MPFERLNESFYDHAITLPVGDRDYTIPSPDADTGLFLQRVTVIGATAARNEPLTDDDKKFLADAPAMGSDEYVDMLLTPELHAQIKADKLNWGAYQKIIGAAMQWIAFGREAAEAFWNAKAVEEGPNLPAPQDHRLPSKPDSARPSRGTSKQTKKTTRSGNPAKRAAGSDGSTSSATGRTSKRTSSSSTASDSGTRRTTKKSPGITSEAVSSSS